MFTTHTSLIEIKSEVTAILKWSSRAVHFATNWGIENLKTKEKSDESLVIQILLE